MLKTKLLHPEILRVLGSCGHFSQVLIADGNYPFISRSPATATKVFLNLTPDRKLETGAAGTGQAGGGRDPKKPEPGTTIQGEPDGGRDATTSGGAGQAGKKVPDTL